MHERPGRRSLASARSTRSNQARNQPGGVARPIGSTLPRPCAQTHTSGGFPRERMPLGRVASTLRIATLAFEQTLDRLGIARAGVHRIFATGMGRENVALADAHRTPMLSHARGAHWWFPAAPTVIDVGAEGSRVMRCDAKGNLT